MKPDIKTDIQRYIGHTVVDRNGERIGTLQCLWSDESGQPAYLGVETGWVFGKTHVVPAEGADVSERGGTIRLPHSAEKVRQAPSYDPSVALDEQHENEVCSHYNIRRGAPTQRESDQPARQAGRGREQTTIPLHEEQVKVGKRQVEAGGVRLRKVIRTETVNQPVELQREEIVVERVPGKSGVAQGKAFEGEDVYIPLRREEAVVQKESRVREEVRVSKQARSDRHTVSERVRKEDVDIESTGEARTEKGGARKTQPAGRERDAGRRAVFCIVRNEQQASRIVDELKTGGFSKNDISVLFADKRGTKDFAHEKHTKAPEGAITGAGTGGILGGALGWLAGMGALAIPGAGPFIAAGPIMAALSGAAVGAGAGTLIGALVGMGIPEYEAKRFEGKLKEGNILISVHSENSDDTRRAKDIFQRGGGEDISTTSESRVPQSSHAE